MYFLDVMWNRPNSDDELQFWLQLSFPSCNCGPNITDTKSLTFSVQDKLIKVSEPCNI